MKIKILSTSDVHGYFFPTNFSGAGDYQPLGYLKAASVVKQQRKQAAPDEIVLYIENGDFLEGSPMTDYAHRTKEQHTNRLMCWLVNQMVPTAAVLGNHEFNYGVEYIQDTWRDRNFPILGANLSGPAVNGLLDGPYQLLAVNGVRIAILGLTTQFIPHWEQSAHIAGVQFESALAAAKHWVPILRQRADVVIVAYHGGFERDLVSGAPTEALTGENEGATLLKQVPGIDALVTGHQHRTIATVADQVPVTQPGWRGEFVGAITLTLDGAHQVVDRAAQLIATADYPVETGLAAGLADWQRKCADWLDEPLATVCGQMQIQSPLAARLHGDAYLDLINRIQMKQAGVDIAGTALFSDTTRGFTDQVTVRDVLNNYPFPNMLVVEAITGADLRAALERCASFFTLQNDQTVTMKDGPGFERFNYDYYSGVDYCFDLTKPVGSRVVQLEYHGCPLGDDQTIKVALNHYRGGGAGAYPMFASNKVVASFTSSIAEMIIDYLRQHHRIIARQPDNLKVIAD